MRQCPENGEGNMNSMTFNETVSWAWFGKWDQPLFDFWMVGYTWFLKPLGFWISAWDKFSVFWPRGVWPWGLVIFLGLMLVLENPIYRAVLRNATWYWQKSKTMNIRRLSRRNFRHSQGRELFDIAWPWVKDRLKSYDCGEILRKIKSLSSHDIQHDFVVQINSSSYLKKHRQK